MNQEGLTKTEWMNAATMGGKFKPAKGEKALMRKEWEAGVDPTEWAHYFEKSYVPTFPKQQPVDGIPLTALAAVPGAAVRRRSDLRLYRILTVRVWDDPMSVPAMTAELKDLRSGEIVTRNYEYLEYWVLQPDPEIFMASHYPGENFGE